jgi:CheY-like chemotaxis protein
VTSRILVVDDCQYVADASARLIAICGYETKAVYDGQEAIEQSIAFSPDMVLMDIGMPGLDGWETALRIRREPAGANIFLVAVTCFSQEQDRQRTYASGFDLHVAKPISLSTLHGLLATLYQRQESANRSALLPTDVVSP